MQDTFNTHVNKAEMDYMIEWDELSDKSKEYIISYGLKQSLNDSVASVKDDLTLAQGISGKRFDAIINGTIGTRQGTVRDPLSREIKAICAQRVAGFAKMDADHKNRLIDGIKLGRNEKTQAILTEAERRVETARTLEIDLTDEELVLQDSDTDS